MRDRLDIHVEIGRPMLTQVAVHFGMRTFRLCIVERNFTFDNHLGVRRHQHIVGLAFDQLERLALEHTDHVVFIRTERADLGTTHGPGDRVRPEHDSGFHGFLAACFRVHQKTVAVLPNFRVHHDARRGFNVRPVGANIAAQVRMFEYDRSGIDITAAIRRIALDPWVLEHVDIAAGDNHFLARRIAILRHDRFDRSPVAMAISKTHQFIHGGTIHFTVVVGHVLDAVTHRLGLPRTIDVGHNRPLHPLAVDFHALHQKGRRPAEAELVNQTIGKAGRFIAILVHLLDAEHLAGRLQSGDVFTHGVIRSRQLDILAEGFGSCHHLASPDCYWL